MQELNRLGVKALTTNDYINRVLNTVREKHSDKEEFVKTLEEFFPTLEPYIDEHPEIEENAILELIAEPERVIQFRVPWQDDHGKTHVNLAWRVQYNSALGPYKGGIRFHPSVNESICRFLGFEQTFKNALTQLPLGGAKGGADFNPRGKSDSEIMRFVQSFMLEMHKYLGPNLDVPAGDIGVGHREIGYMYGQYKRLKQSDPGVLTGKPVHIGGSFGRTEATGYGIVYFAENALKDRGDSLKGKKVIVSGLGQVGKHAIEKAVDLGAKVIAVGDLEGYLVDENGLDAQVLKAIVAPERSEAEKYVKEHPDAHFVPEKSVWTANIKYDIALPCATQGEIDGDMAKNMVENCEISAIFEGANKPTKDTGVKVFIENDILFAPAKAVNAGGVAASGFEMAQNAQHQRWTFEEVDQNVQDTMADIYELCSRTAEQYLGNKNDLKAGANIAGFARVAEAMISQGLV